MFQKNTHDLKLIQDLEKLMGFFTKTDYEKHTNNLNKKSTKIVKTMTSHELKELCQKVIGKYPVMGTRIFDSEYNLIEKFGHMISHDNYMLYFSHNRKQGKFSDLKLAKFLVNKDILDEKDPDYDYLKQFAKSEDELDYPTPRNSFSQKIKYTIRKMQRNRCKIPDCRNRDFFEFDHIKGRDDNSLSNCQMLCLYHHQLKTNEDAIKLRIEKNLNDGKPLNEIDMPRLKVHHIPRINMSRSGGQRRNFQKNSTRRTRRRF